MVAAICAESNRSIFHEKISIFCGLLKSFSHYSTVQWNSVSCCTILSCTFRHCEFYSVSLIPIDRKISLVLDCKACFCINSLLEDATKQRISSEIPWQLNGYVFNICQVVHRLVIYILTFFLNQFSSILCSFWSQFDKIHQYLIFIITKTENANLETQFSLIRVLVRIY